VAQLDVHKHVELLQRSANDYVECSDVAFSRKCVRDAAVPVKTVDVLLVCCIVVAPHAAMAVSERHPQAGLGS